MTASTTTPSSSSATWRSKGRWRTMRMVAVRGWRWGWGWVKGILRRRWGRRRGVSATVLGSVSHGVGFRRLVCVRVFIAGFVAPVVPVAVIPMAGVATTSAVAAHLSSPRSGPRPTPRCSPWPKRGSGEGGTLGKLWPCRGVIDPRPGPLMPIGIKRSSEVPEGSLGVVVVVIVVVAGVIHRGEVVALGDATRKLGGRSSEFRVSRVSYIYASQYISYGGLGRQDCLHATHIGRHSHAALTYRSDRRQTDTFSRPQATHLRRAYANMTHMVGSDTHVRSRTAQKSVERANLLLGMRCALS